MSQKQALDKTRAARAKMAASGATTQPTSPTSSSQRSNIGGNGDHSELDGISKIMARLDELDHKWEDRHDEASKKVEQLQITTDATAKKMAVDIASLASLLDDSRNDAERCKIELQETSRKLFITTNKLGYLMASNKRLENRVNDIENRARILNLKIDGKPEDSTENLGQYLTDLISYLNVPNVTLQDICTIARIGKFQNQMAARQQHAWRKQRQIMVVFNNIAARNTFYYARTKLNKSQQYPNVYINDDVTVDTLKHREDYRSVAALARKGGADIKVHGDGIIIDGTKYKHTDVLPDKFSLSRAKTHEHQGRLFFHSIHSPLSNFHPSPIVVDGRYYPTAEHFYQSEKCKAMSDADSAARVMETPHPLEAKRATSHLTENAEWLQCKDNVMSEIVKSKFEQNAHLREMLLATGDKELNEATNDTHFGMGAALHSRAMRDLSYTGANKLGRILAVIRDDYRTENSVQGTSSN